MRANPTLRAYSLPPVQRKFAFSTLPSKIMDSLNFNSDRSAQYWLTAKAGAVPGHFLSFRPLSENHLDALLLLAALIYAPKMIVNIFNNT